MSKAVILQHVAHEGPGGSSRSSATSGSRRGSPALRRATRSRRTWTRSACSSSSAGRWASPTSAATKYPFLAKEVETLKRMVAARSAGAGDLPGRAAPGPCGGGEGVPERQARPRRRPTRRPRCRRSAGGRSTFPFPGGTEPIVFGHDRRRADVPLALRHVRPAQAARPGESPPPRRAAAADGQRRCSARRKACRNQAFRFKTRLFGFQYHIELTPPASKRSWPATASSSSKSMGPTGAEDPRGHGEALPAVRAAWATGSWPTSCSS